jgi:hypothetical protein
VRLTIGPGWGHLCLWGRDPSGTWWALVTWPGWVSRGFESATELACSGWAPADHVMQSPGVVYDRVARVLLSAAPADWPRPPQSQHHVGILAAGEQVAAPDGWRWSSPRLTSRERPKRYEQAARPEPELP